MIIRIYPDEVDRVALVTSSVETRPQCSRYRLEPNHAVHFQFLSADMLAWEKTIWSTRQGHLEGSPVRGELFDLGHS